MARKNYTISIDCPDGYKPIAFREPVKGDTYYTYYGVVVESGKSKNKSGPRLILEKIIPITRTFIKVATDLRPKVGQYVSFDKSNLPGTLYYCDDASDIPGYGDIWEEVTGNNTKTVNT